MALVFLGMVHCVVMIMMMVMIPLTKMVHLPALLLSTTRRWDDRPGLRLFPYHHIRISGFAGMRRIANSGRKK